jgi:DNA polymerase III delta subunit
MIYYLFGKDDFRKRLRIEELKNSYLKNNYQIFKFEEENFSDLERDLKSNSLFTSRKVYLIFDSSSIIEFLKTNRLFSFFENDSNVLILKFQNQDKNLKRLTNLKIIFEEFEPLKNLELEKWLKNYSQSLKIEISSGQLKELISLFGNNLELITNELLKLSLYKPLSKITNDDFQKVITSYRELNYFKWLEAIFKRDLAGAINFEFEENEAARNLAGLLNALEKLVILKSSKDKEFLKEDNLYWLNNLKSMAYNLKKEEIENWLDFLINETLLVYKRRITSQEALERFIYLKL